MNDLSIAWDNVVHSFGELFNLKRWTQNTLGSGVNPIRWFSIQVGNWLNEVKKRYGMIMLIAGGFIIWLLLRSILSLK